MTDRATHKKYFFFDIDSTLTARPGSSKVPASAKEAINELQSRGHFCALATGRAQYHAKEFGEIVGINNLVSDGGNGVTINGRLICQIPLPHEKCTALAEECDQKGFLWAILDKNRPVCSTKFPDFGRIVGDKYMRSDVVPDLDMQDYPNIYKMFVPCKPGSESVLHSLTALTWARYDSDLVIIEPMNKSVGIRRILDLCSASDEDVVVFGDAANDLSMFMPEWTRIAMGNAIPELKEQADFVTKGAAYDGIAYALRHFGWIT